MAEVVLNDDLIDEYLKYLFQDDFNPKKIQNLFKYIETFSLRDTHSIMDDPSMPLMLENDPLIEIVDGCSDEMLVDESTFKLMLTDKASIRSFTTLNILGRYEKLSKRFGGSYSNNIDKDKAQKHIKSLLFDAKWIRVSDRYISKNQSQWRDYQDILKSILPNSTIDVTIQSYPIISDAYKKDLKNIFSNWKKIKGQEYNIRTTHDRYIETNKIIILLSSGLYHLSTKSRVDFTYIITIKK